MNSARTCVPPLARRGVVQHGARLAVGEGEADVEAHHGALYRKLLLQPRNGLQRLRRRSHAVCGAGAARLAVSGAVCCARTSKSNIASLGTPCAHAQKPLDMNKPCGEHVLSHDVLSTQLHALTRAWAHLLLDVALRVDRKVDVAQAALDEAHGVRPVRLGVYALFEDDRGDIAKALIKLHLALPLGHLRRRTRAKGPSTLLCKHHVAHAREPWCASAGA